MLIGERLKAVREAKNMSQGDVEKATGLLRCYVSRVENGHTVPALETLEKLSKALNVTMSELFAEDGKAAKPLAALKASNGQILTRKAANNLRRIETAFSHMKPQDMSVVVGLARKFAGR